MIERALRENQIEPSKYRLVMTLLARDEADIIRQNIDFHLSRGVDFIIATDNASADGTRDILEVYRKQGLIHLIDEKRRDHSQADWVNRMGRIAYEEYSADIIFHCDADEFWYPESGNLKVDILSQDADVLYVNIINVLLENKGGSESFPDNARYAVVNPIETADFKEDSKEYNIYLLKYPGKVIFKTSRGFIEVVDGNHDITTHVGSFKKGVSQDISIYHYPVRNKDQYYRKIKNGGSALLANERLSEDVGWHWRRWYESYLKGRLDIEYNKLLLMQTEASRLNDEGIIEKHNFNHFIINSSMLGIKSSGEEYYRIDEQSLKSSENNSLGNAAVNMLFSPHRGKQYTCTAASIDRDGPNSSQFIIANSISENSTVLDVGCSHGYLGEWLANKKNCKIYGIDVNHEALNIGMKGGFYEDTFLIDLDNPGACQNELARFMSLGDVFDYVIYADVLEHLKDPTAALVLLVNKLKFGGKAVVSVPNISNMDIILNLLEGRFNYSEFGILDNTHLRFFTRRSFAEWIMSANDAFEDFKLDLELIGSTKYASDFVNVSKEKYPFVAAVIKSGPEFEVLQNVFELTKIEKSAVAEGLNSFLLHVPSASLKKIQSLLGLRPSFVSSAFSKMKWWIVPWGSRRRRIFDNIVHPSRLINVQNITKSISYIKEQGLIGFLRKVKQKLTS